MRKTFFPYHFVDNDTIRQSIKSILSQLENYNYAIISNPNAIQQFSRTIPTSWKDTKIITFVSKGGNNFVILSQQHKITPKTEKKYKLTTKK